MSSDVSEELHAMKTENVNFAEALKILAYRAGIVLPEYERKSGKRKCRISKCWIWDLR